MVLSWHCNALTVAGQCRVALPWHCQDIAPLALPSHCGALHFDTTIHKWINMEFTHANIKVEILDEKQSDNLFNKLLAFKILICPQKEDWHLMRIKELSCVSFVMRLIGFFRWYVITPHQLYCALIKNGYEPFWKHDRPKKKIATRNN